MLHLINYYNNNKSMAGKCPLLLLHNLPEGFKFSVLGGLRVQTAIGELVLVQTIA